VISRFAASRVLCSKKKTRSVFRLPKKLPATPLSQQPPCSDKEIHWQFVRYAILGFYSNAILYFIYLVATNFGIGYKAVMMILLYAIGILQTFLFNRCGHMTIRGLAQRPSFVTFQSMGLATYLIWLHCFYLWANSNSPTSLYRGFLIFVVPMLLFLFQKFWVFNDKQKAAI